MGQQGQMPDPRQLEARELMLKAELLKIQAMKKMMGLGERGGDKNDKRR